LPDKAPLQSRWERFNYCIGKAAFVPASQNIKDNEEVQKRNGLNLVLIYTEDLILLDGGGGERGGGAVNTISVGVNVNSNEIHLHMSTSRR
jgi:hypothetical protein